MLVRPAVPGDIDDIARINVDSWRATYRGILPDAVLDDLSYAEYAVRWSLRLEEPGETLFLVATGGGHVRGFVSGGRERSGDSLYTGEIYSIYLDPACLRQGIGTLLAKGLALALRDRGHRALLVWVLSANPARNFYAALGATFVREGTLTIGGAVLSSCAYGWQDIDRLIEG
jgi:GNAT superfamily N-acetyltransferase